ncbi:Agamous-like MADS-box protein AGL16 [Striga hermonthica]|uniref:Agamous-like MADS-box protein AGL16 n=1 Tax=Striga hermonthica TaxID=68872 RepID=A0A9N7NJ89_STRHE|nr:Agamous-like MADS-box protein AGL16 [Striga hermonthica]
MIQQENIELHKKINLLLEENAKLQKKVYGHVTSTINNERNLNAPINLELSQPQHQKNEAPEVVELG